MLPLANKSAGLRAACWRAARHLSGKGGPPGDECGGAGANRPPRSGRQGRGPRSEDLRPQLSLGGLSTSDLRSKDLPQLLQLIHERALEIEARRRASRHLQTTAPSRVGFPLLPLPPPALGDSPAAKEAWAAAMAAAQAQQPDEAPAGPAAPEPAPLPTPKQIRAFLDQHIIGQEDMKRRLAIALHNHYLRVEHNNAASASGRGSARVTVTPRVKPAAAPGPRSTVVAQAPFSAPPTMTLPSAAGTTMCAGDSPTMALSSEPPSRLWTAPSATRSATAATPADAAEEPVLVEKSNVLLIGPSGSGKTMVVKTIAKLLDVPFSLNDATPLTQAGYVGEDVEVCVYRLLQNAEFDVARAERGIIFLDEIDKIGRRADAGGSPQRDVSGEGVQQGLLRILEGTTVNFNVKVSNLPPSRRPPGVGAAATEAFAVNTSNILFVCSGAFVGLEKLVKSRLSVKSTIGFGAAFESDAPRPALAAAAAKPQQAHANDSADMHWLPDVEPDDLIRYGFIPEFVGRLPVVVTARPLLVDELARILTEPKNSLVQQYQQIFARFGVQLVFTPRSLQAVAQVALSKKTGARGLRRIVENVLSDVQYELPGSGSAYAVVTSGSVLRSEPVLVFHKGQEAAMDASISADSL